MERYDNQEKRRGDEGHYSLLTQEEISTRYKKADLSPFEDNPIVSDNRHSQNFWGWGLRGDQGRREKASSKLSVVRLEGVRGD